MWWAPAAGTTCTMLLAAGRWQAERQPGSSFKTFVYTTAIECGYSPSVAVADSPITIGNWSPKNLGTRKASTPGAPSMLAVKYSA